ncbi:MAG: hypothetical protein IPF87_16335 [Gemmatimonadetes bacterium]|nr:hypothetical protein [Gemmatimonadota bacterium]
MIAFPDDSTAVVSVVTFDPSYGPALAAAIDREWDRLRERRWVVIDLRGNEGGSSGQVRAVAPFPVGRPLAVPTRRMRRHLRTRSCAVRPR